MKTYFLILLFFNSLIAIAQTDPSIPPFKRFPSFPPVKLLKADGSVFDKEALSRKSPVMLMLFNPACEHCRQETTELTRNMNLFKKVQIVMATSAPFDSMIVFIRNYSLNNFDNIIVGRDEHYFLPTFFRIRNLPFLAFYDKKKGLIDIFEGAMPIPQIAEIFKK
ncbi:MAG TPA: thioredoxin [Chitinophagaceae bacterium]|nr:thioredoxin [Chitinophagaceae bacterium]